MSWIERVRLENFQSHVDTTLELSDGLNVIVGQSDSGKTAIIRAIRWALFNQPRGTDFIHVGANFVRVTVTFSTGVTIIRERTSSKNRYLIQEKGKEDMVLEGFGIHVPKEVLDAHGIKPLRIDQDTELNLHLSGQLEGPFLLEQTSSVRAKTIGRMSGAHILDMAIRDTTRDTTKLTQYIRAHTEDVERLEASLQPYQFLEGAKVELDNALKQLANLAEKQKKRVRIMKIATSLKALHEQEQEVHKTIARLQDIEQWQIGYERLIQRIERQKRLVQLSKYRQEMEGSLVHCHEWLMKTAEIDSAKTKAELLMKAISKQTQLIRLKKRNEQQRVEAEREINVLRMTTFATVAQEQQIDSIKAMTDKLRHLQRLSQQINRQETEINQLNKINQQLATLDDAIARLTYFEKEEQRLQSLKNIREQYTGLQKRTQDGAKFIADKKLEEQQLIHQYEHLLLEGGTCPTCGSQLEKENIQKLLKQ